MMQLSRKHAVFTIIYVSYAVSYIARRNYALWSHAWVTDGDISAADAGWFGTAFETLGGIVKVAGGFYVDSYSPSWILAASLASMGVANMGMLLAPSLLPKVVLWGLNGGAQALAWPALAKVFMAWFPSPLERGLWYSVLATSQNAGAALVPVLLTWPTAAYGWQASLLVPAAMALAYAGICMVTLKDAPSAAAASKRAPALVTAPPGAMSMPTASATVASTAPPPSTAAPSSNATNGSSNNDGDRGGALHAIRTVLSSRALSLLAVNYFFNTLVRNTLTDWVIPIVVSATGDAAGAAACMAAYEAGGALGGLLAGGLSDTFFRGRRAPVMTIFGVLLAPLLLLPHAAGGGADVAAGVDVAGAAGGALSLPALYFALGVAAFAPHVLNGLVSREVVPPAAQSTAGGFTKACGQIGGAAAGYPVARLAAAHGWRSVLTVMCAASLASAAAALPLWNMQAWRPTVPPVAPATGAGVSNDAHAARAADGAAASTVPRATQRRQAANDTRSDTPQRTGSNAPTTDDADNSGSDAATRRLPSDAVSTGNGRRRHR